MDFYVEHRSHVTGPALGMVVPESLTYQLALNEPSTVNYQLSLEHQMAKEAYTYPYKTDFILYRGSAFIGGLHTEIAIDDKMQDYLQISGKSWLHYLDKRIWPFDPANPAANLYSVTARDLKDIAQDLVSQVGAGDPLQVVVFTLANTATGQTANFSIGAADTESILSKIGTLSGLNPGFDFWDTPDKGFILQAGQRGTDKSPNVTFKVDKNSQVIGYNNTGPNATKVTVFGEGTTSRLGSVSLDTGARDAYRLLDYTTDIEGVTNQTALDTYAAAEALRQATPQEKFTAKWVDQNTDIYSLVGLGDIVAIDQDFGYKYIQADARIVGFDGTVTDETFEEVTVTFDDPSVPILPGH